MDLPLEVRLKVYELALATTVTLFPRDYIRISEPIIIHGIALLLSSRNIKDEALPIFYAVNQFHSVMGENGPICTTNSSNHFDKMRYISISYESYITPESLAKLLNKFLDEFPQLHSFSFYPDGTKPCPLLDSTTKAIRDLRERLKSIRVILFLEDEDEDEDNLQDLLNVIRPHDEWRLQTCNHWPHFPTWRFDRFNTPGVGVQVRVGSTTQPVCGVEEL